MVAPRVRVERGFETGEAKLAFIEGRIEWAAAAPAGVRDQLARDPARSTPLSAGASLVIAAAERSATDFLTDRGLRRLPAWRLLADGAIGPIWVLDPEVAVWQPAGYSVAAPPDLQAPNQDPAARIEIAGDDRTVTVHWLGAASDYERSPSAEAIESNHAVTFVAHGRDAGWTGMRLAIGHVHQVPAVLKTPLGARVFVDLHGNAGQVIPS